MTFEQEEKMLTIYISQRNTCAQGNVCEGKRVSFKALALTSWFLSGPPTLTVFTSKRLLCVQKYFVVLLTRNYTFI